MGQQGELRAWLQFLTGVPVQRPEEIKAKTFCLAQSITDIQKIRCQGPKTGLYLVYQSTARRPAWLK